MSAEDVPDDEMMANFTDLRQSDTLDRQLGVEGFVRNRFGFKVTAGGQVEWFRSFGDSIFADKMQEAESQ